MLGTAAIEEDCAIALEIGVVNEELTVMKD